MYNNQNKHLKAISIKIMKNKYISNINAHRESNFSIIINCNSSNQILINIKSILQTV